MDAESTASPPTRRQRRTAEIRTRLLDAATAVFLARGYDAAALGEVTERADVGTGTLYLHFADKRALYEAVARRALDGLYQRWQAAAATAASSDARVLAMVQVALEFFTANREQARLFLLDGPAVESWLVDDVVRGIALVLEGPQRELRASLVIGLTLAAARHYARAAQPAGTRAFVDTVLAACAGAIAAPSRGGRSRRTMRGTR